jgi:hypothetical protein
MPAAERIDVDPFAGIDDPVEILRLIHRPPRSDDKTRYLPCTRATGDVYRALTQADVDRLVATAAGDPKLLRNVASGLACFSSCDMTTCQNRLLDGGDPYPPHAFRGAPDLVVQRILTRVDAAAAAGGSLVLSHALSALAWSGSPRAEMAQRRWRDRPPTWRREIHCSPEEYALVAGYELEGDGRRDLLLPSAHRLTIDDAGTGGAAVFEGDPSGKRCPQCERPATLLLRIEAPQIPAGLSLGPHGAFRVPTCVDCTMYGPVFVSLSDDPARWEWLAPLSASSADHAHPLELPPTPVTLTPRAPWAAVDWCIAEGISQLGGHPSWISDPVFPPCPACARTMMTIAQVAPEDFVRAAEGVFYVHLCAPCAVVGVSYDQT